MEGFGGGAAGGVTVLRCHVAKQHGNKTVNVQVLGWLLSSAGVLFIVASEVLPSSSFLVVRFSLRCLKKKWISCTVEAREKRRIRGEEDAGKVKKKNGRQRQTGSGDSDRERADSWDSSRGESIDPGE